MGDGGLYQAWLLDGAGGGRELDWDGVRAHTDGDDLMWVDLNFSFPEARQWLNGLASVPEVAREAMIAKETRPDLMQFEGGMLIVLRGVNLNLGARAEDMISIRVWIDRHRIVTCRQRELQSVRKLSDDIREGNGARSSGELLAGLAGELAKRIRRIVSDMEDRLAQVETGDDVAGQPLEEIYSDIRRTAAVFRRHLNPQRETLQSLQNSRTDLLGTEETDDLRVYTDFIIHSIEDLEVLREHTQALQDELFSAMTRTQNIRIYMLTIVAAIFLPLTFISGLLGMNVGGIPGAESPMGFWIIVLMCLAMVVLIMLYFRERKWL